MNDVIDFLTSKELIVVYVVVLLVCISYFVIYVINKTCQNRKKKQNTKELNRLVEQIEEKLEDEQKYVPNNICTTQIEEIAQNILYVENVEEKKEVQNNIEMPQVTEEDKIETLEVVAQPIVIENKNITTNEIKEVKQPTIIQPEIKEVIEEKFENMVLESMSTLTSQEELQYTTIEPNAEEAQAELRRLTEELQKAQEETKNISLASLEEEQEANAIISLEEFIKRCEGKQYETSVEQYEEDDENKPISIEELEKMKNKIAIETIEEEQIEEITEVKEPHQEKMILDEFNNIKIEESPIKAYTEEKKFKSSPVISPVYGIEHTTIQENNMELENTANYEKLDEEIKKTNEFLMTLKELQKNLQ